jgi:hypothetical protein
MVLEQKHHTHATLDNAVLDHTLAGDRALQLRNHGSRAKLRVAGDADRVPTQAFDPIMPARGFNVDQGTKLQVPAI